VMVLAKPNPAGPLFTTIVIVAFTFKLLEVVSIIVNVVTVNAFFIDWEQVSFLSDAHCCHMATAIYKHHVSDRIKPSFVIFDIRAL